MKSAPIESVGILPASNVPAGWLRRHRGDLLAVVVLAAMTLAVFWKGFADPPGMIQGDSAYLYQDYYTLAAREVRAGRVPLWNPCILMGVPFHASLQPALFYPLRWPMFFMDYVPGLIFTIMLHYFLGAVAAYLFIRVAVGVSPVAALIGAMSIAFGGLAMGHASHPNYFLAYPWFFGTMLFLWLAVKRGRWRWAVPAGGCIGMMALIGAVHLLLVLGVLIGTYVTYHTVLAAVDRIGRRTKGWAAIVHPAGAALAALALGAAIGAIQLLPARALSKASVRQEASWEFINMAVAATGANSLQMVVPFYWGNMRLGYWNEFSYDEMAHYAGIVVLLGAAAGVTRLGRDRHLWALVVLAAVGFLLGAGNELPFYRIFYELLPPFRQLRNPTRIFWLTDIALACLAAVGVDRVLLGRRSAPTAGKVRSGDGAARRHGPPKLPSPSNAPRKAVCVVGAVVLVVLAGSLVKLHGYATDPSAAKALIDTNKKIVRDLTRPVHDMWYGVRVNDALTGPKRIFEGDFPTWLGVAAAVASVAFVGFLVLRKGPAGRWAGAALVLLLSADLLALSGGMIMYNRQFDLMRKPPEWAQWLQDRVGNQRFSREIFGRPQTSHDLSDVNRGMLLGVRQLHGLGGGIVDSPARSQFIGLASEPIRGRTQTGQVVERWELMDTLKNVAGVKYLMVDSSVALPESPLHLASVWHDDQWRIYENLSCLPMAYFVEEVKEIPSESVLPFMAGAQPAFDPRKTAIVSVPPPPETASAKPGRRDVVRTDSCVPGRWEIQTDTEAPAQLVVSEGYDPGWRCEIDGQPQPVTIYRTDDQIMSVPVPAGKKKVVLTYDPPEFRTGVKLTAAGVVAFLALLVGAFIIGRRMDSGRVAVRDPRLL